jgi:hypothetical protein
MSKSTGPRTPRGKARSSKNAAKHWIEAGRILPDEQQDAAVLRSAFEEDFKPQGLIEEEIIDDLVFNRLIKRRIDIAFTREFSKASIETTIKEMDRRERPATQYWLRVAGLWNDYRTEREGAERLESPYHYIGSIGCSQGEHGFYQTNSSICRVFRWLAFCGGHFDTLERRLELSVQSSVQSEPHGQYRVADQTTVNIVNIMNIAGWVGYVN